MKLENMKWNNIKKAITRGMEVPLNDVEYDTYSVTMFNDSENGLTLSVSDSEGMACIGISVSDFMKSVHSIDSLIEYIKDTIRCYYEYDEDDC